MLSEEGNRISRAATEGHKTKKQYQRFIYIGTWIHFPYVAIAVQVVKTL